MPSPSSPDLHVGPLSGHWYGLCVALGAALFVVITALLWRRRGGRWDVAFWIALAALPAGLVGARLYHLVTGGASTPGEHAIAVWEGGLGIFGAVAAGALVVVIGARLAGVDPLRLVDCAVVGLAVGQAVGRVGNWFNQELYGEPTDLPWGLAIDPQHRLAGYAAHAHFHPTFLYESLWDLALAGGLAWLLLRRPPARRGIAAAMWMVGYGLGRFWIEGLRIEPATTLGPLRLNQVVALAVAAVGAALVVALARRPS